MRQSEVQNIDCMIGMKQYPDKYFDLAVVDPPYGIGFDGEVEKMANNNSKKWNNARGSGYERKKWDSQKPDEEYFNELFRVSKNQIIWGGNYFKLPHSTGWIFWDKGVPDDFTLSPGELAWTSFNKSVSRVSVLWAGFRKANVEHRIHPTQKPVKLYGWIYKKYLPEGGKVIDTHLGSGSNRIAADKAGNIDFTGYELDKDYYEVQEQRWKNYKSQLNLFA